MDAELRDKIHDLVIGKDSLPEPWQRGARAILTVEARSLLEGAYGLDRTGTLAAPERLPLVQTDPETRETYECIERYLADELGAGIPGVEAAEQLVRQVAFTHLNRFVAFKMLEARGLIRETLRRGPDANGFKFYLAGHPEEEARWRDGEIDAAYRRFLLWQSGVIAREVRVLFDPDDLASRLFPRPPALKEILTLLNDERAAPAWAEEETIGWVYQYFNEREKADVFRRLYKEKQKIRRQDIPAATQLFTPRWIVSFLVQNTLGRTWLQMHPDSNLATEMDLLVPLAGEIPVAPVKPVRELTILDPACGTMHFGLVAFDLLVEMYREEMAHAGEAGWPETPSVLTEEEIPAAIISHNLHGIDIDLRAVQLAALALYLKAKTLNPTAVLRQSNLVATDVLPFQEEDLTAFLAEMQFTDPIYERVLRTLWPRLRELPELGSLARLETDIARVVAEERRRRAKEERKAPLFADLETGSDRHSTDADAWWYVEEQISLALDYYAKHSAERGIDQTHFVGEVTKGLRLLELMRRRYDVVLSNPPYLTNFTDTLKTTLARDYPTAKSDTYAAFIVRCVDWLKDGGRVGMITQQSFMFLSSYEKLRTALLDKVAIETMAHTGPHAFEEIGGAKVSTAVFTLRREERPVRRLHSSGTFVRLVEAESKESFLREILSERKLTHTLRQDDIDLIPGGPWVYWISNELRDLFRDLPRLADRCTLLIGVRTSDNARFIRYWWEVGNDGTELHCESHQEALQSGKKWFPHVKGGEYKKWYGNQELVVNWYSGGAEMKEAIMHAYPYLGRPWIGGSSHYFQEGLTWTLMTAKGFGARFMSAGFITGGKGPAMYAANRQNLLEVLGILNSTPAGHLLNVLSPGLGFEIGHVGLLPVPANVSPLLATLASRAVALRRKAETWTELSYEFVVPESRIPRAYSSSAMGEIQGRIDELVYEAYDLSPDHFSSLDSDDLQAAELTASSNENDEQGSFDGPTEQSTFWLSYAVGIVLGRFQPGVEGALGSAIVEDEDGTTRHQFSAEVEARLRGLADADGIAPLDAGHADDLAAKVELALELMLGEREAHDVVQQGAGGDLRKFLEKEYWQKHHLKWYRKRPPYWLLQSPKKLYSLYVFHERVTSDTLFLIEQRYLGPKLVATRNAIAELSAQALGAAGREKRALEKEAEAREALLADLREFGRRIRAITDRGYRPHIDDGILLRLAPLHTIIPSFAKEPREAWEKLARGDYDWAHLAMDHWPERVQTKCRTDKSLAIAHGRLDLYQEGATQQ